MSNPRRIRVISLMKRSSGFCLFLPLLFVTSPRPVFDLDTDVPVGPPADWARGAPVQTPIFPSVRTQARFRSPTASGPAVDTAVEPRTPTVATDIRSLKSLSLNEIVTVDVVSHIPWTDPGGKYATGSPGGGGRAKSIQEWERVYWVGLVPLLRVLLHPEQVPRIEATAHLIELGDAALPAARAGLSEGALRDICSEVGGTVGTPPSGNIKYLEGSSPYEKMMFRFVANELAAANPYDPQGNFGRKLEMIGDEVVPYILAYTSHEHATIRRNAVSALALLRARGIAEHLLQLALSSSDAVVRMRAFGLLTSADLSSAQILQICAALDKEKNLTFAARYIQTLGELRDPAAVPSILQIAKKNASNEDLLPSCLVALARIGSPGANGEVSNFAQQIYKKTKSTPGAFAVKGRSMEHVADAADPENGRTLLIGQLALIVLAKTTSLDAARQKELLDLSSFEIMNANKRNAGPRRFMWGARSSELGGVAPYLQFDYLETIARSPASENLLLEIARRDTNSTITRSYAMRLLPDAARLALAREWMESKAIVPPELRIAALDALDAVNATDVQSLALEFLRITGIDTILTMRLPAQRMAALRTLQLLSTRDAFPVDRVLNYVELLRPRKSLLADITKTTRESCKALVALAASGEKEYKWRDAAVRVIEDLYAQFEPYYIASDANWKQSALRFCLDSLKSVSGRKNDEKFKTSATDTLLSYFIGPLNMAIMEDGMSMKSTLPIEESIILMLGKVKDPRIPPVLQKAASTDGFAYVPAVCLALGQLRAKTAARGILPFLLHADPFTRLCAYRALKQITGQDYFADWIGGSVLEWGKASQQYEQWIVR